jgi:hypothetical protein
MKEDTTNVPPTTPTEPAAIWRSGAGTPLPITVSNVTPVTITLKPYDPTDPDVTENGTFAWKITNQITSVIPTSFTSAKMTVKDLTGAILSATTTPAITWTNPIVLNTSAPVTNWTNTTGVSIMSGYYYVDIELIIDGATKYFRHVLHIYQNFTSTFEYIFTDDHIGVTGVTFTPLIDYEHPKDNPPTVAVAPSSSSNFTVAIGDGSWTDPYLLSLSGLTLPKELEITVTYLGTPEFYYGSTLLGSGASLIIPATAPFNTVGTYQVLVVGTATADGKPYEKEIAIKVVDDKPKLTPPEAGGYYNPPGLNMTIVTGPGTNEETITLTGTVANIANGNVGWNPELVSPTVGVHRESWLKGSGYSEDPGSPYADGGIDLGYTIVTLSGLSPVGVPFTRTLYNEGINLYLPPAHANWTDYGLSTVSLTASGTSSSAADFAFILWGGATTREVRIEITIGGVMTTYIIDWSGVTITP